MDHPVVPDHFDVELLVDWIPIRFYWQDRAPRIDWCYVGDRRFVDTSFSATIKSCLNLPFNQMFRHQTGVEALFRFAEEHPGIQPTGFVFHVSRCGSALASQTLCSIAKNLVLCEPDPIDSILRSPATEDQKIRWLRSIVTAMGRPRCGESNLFITFDSWNAVNLPLIRRAFPDVPFIFLYRSPLEVLASQLRQRPVHTVPGMIEPSLFGLDSGAALKLSAVEYCASILASIFQSLLENADNRCTLINYQELPDAIWSRALNFAGAKIAESDKATMIQAANIYIEHPEFRSESATQHVPPSDPIYLASEKLVRPIYDSLESARCARRLASSS